MVVMDKENLLNIIKNHEPEDAVVEIMQTYPQLFGLCVVHGCIDKATYKISYSLEEGGGGGESILCENHFINSMRYSNKPRSVVKIRYK